MRRRWADADKGSLGAVARERLDRSAQGLPTAKRACRLEQDHRGIKGRYRPMRGFKCPRSAARLCRGHDELRNYLRPRSHRNQNVPALRRRLSFLRRSVTVLAILEAA